MKKIILGIVLGLGLSLFAEPIPIPQAETDPCFAAVDNHTNWNTAYGWDNHALQHYFDTDINDLDDITAGSTNVHLTTTLKGNYDAAYTHSQDNTQAHSDYLLNTGDTASGDYNFDANTFYVDSVNHRVGIGTNSPQRNLHVYQSTNAVMGFYVDNPNTGVAARSACAIGNSPYTSPYDGFYMEHLGTNYTTSGLRIASSSLVYDGIGTLSIGTIGAYPLNFFTNGLSSADMTLSSTGKLGIGTISPNTTLEVVGTAAIGTGYVTPGLSFMATPVMQIVGNVSNVAGIEMRNESTGTAADFRFILYNAVDDCYLAVALPGSGNTATLFGETRSDIATIFSNPDSGGTGRKLVIGTVDSNPLYLGTVNTKRVLIGTDGSVTMPDVYSDSVGVTNRDLYIDNTGLIGYDSSSLIHKSNIKDFTDASFLYQLKPKIYDKDNGAKDEVGLIAEDVAKVYPQAVSYRRGENKIDTGEKDDANNPVVKVEYYTTDEPETVNYSRLIVPLLAEVQKLNERVIELEKKVEALEKKK